MTEKIYVLVLSFFFFFLPSSCIQRLRESWPLINYILTPSAAFASFFAAFFSAFFSSFDSFTFFADGSSSSSFSSTSIASLFLFFFFSFFCGDASRVVRGMSTSASSPSSSSSAKSCRTLRMASAFFDGGAPVSKKARRSSTCARRASPNLGVGLSVKLQYNALRPKDMDRPE